MGHNQSRGDRADNFAEARDEPNFPPTAAIGHRTLPSPASSSALRSSHSNPNSNANAHASSSATGAATAAPIPHAVRPISASSVSAVKMPIVPAVSSSSSPNPIDATPINDAVS